MTKLEKQCKDMSDICELAHNRTVASVRAYNKTHKRKITLNCNDKDCPGYDEYCSHYSPEAQDIFNSHFDHIAEVTGI